MNHKKISKTLLSFLIFFSILLASCGSREEKIELKTGNDSLSYSIGVNISNNIKQSFDQNKIEENPDIFIYAVKDILTDRPLMLTEDETMKILTNFQSEMLAKQEAEMADNLAAATAFLNENSGKPGVKSLPSGIQYEVIKDGTGATPKYTDTVKVNYRGYLLDGTEFDSSYNRGEPGVFEVNRIIPGWTEVLQLMKTGSNWKVYIPPDMAYGENPQSPGIPPNALLIFEIELMEIMQ